MSTRVKTYLFILLLVAFAELLWGVTGSQQTWTLGTSPGNPSAGKIRTWANSSTGKLECLDSSGASCMASGASLDQQYRGICQNTVGSFGVSFGTDASVSVGTCPSLTNVVTGQLSFADSGAVTVWSSFLIPATIPTSITFTTGIVSGSTSQAYKTRLYTACVTGTQDPTFNTAQTLNFTSSGTAGNETTQTISSVTLTGCSGGNRLIWKFDRDTTDTSTVALLVNYFRFVGN